VTAEILTSARFRDAGFANGFSCRGADEKALATALSVREIAQIKQVHGARVVRLSELHAGAAEVIGDAIVASAKDAKDGRAIAIRVADCVPILVADKVTGSVAAIHAGWRGVEANVIAEAMKAMDAIEDLAGCTKCDDEARFFSFRRDGENAGRHLAAIVPRAPR
jgi:copper oxidase (laccase) domain-containing protein